MQIQLEWWPADRLIDKIGGHGESSRELIKVNTVFANIKDFLFEEEEEEDIRNKNSLSWNSDVHGRYPCIRVNWYW